MLFWSWGPYLSNLPCGTQGLIISKGRKVPPGLGRNWGGHSGRPWLLLFRHLSAILGVARPMTEGWAISPQLLEPLELGCREAPG